ELDSLAASGTQASGAPVAGRWHVNPEMAAGGLWTTPSDLARLAIAVARAYRENHPGTVPSHRAAMAMLTPRVPAGVIDLFGPPADPDGMSCGWFVGAKTHRFGHIGGNVGYKASMIFWADRGDGVVVMTNNEAGLAATIELIDAIARHYGWDYTVPP